MNTTLEQFSQLPFNHHAYVIESSESIFSQLKHILPIKDFSYIVHKQFNSLKVDDARTIRSLQNEKTVTASLFVLEFILINNEAQNTLLKILEEPTPHTYFILVCPNIKKLLPTLQSRLEHINLPKVQPAAPPERIINIDDFIKFSLSERLDFIKKKTDKKAEQILTKSDILIFLNDLEIYVQSQSLDKFSYLAEVIFQARDSLHAKGASHKMILEMIAIHI